MNQKRIGAVVIVAGLLLAGAVFLLKAQEDAYIKVVIQERSSCYLDDGTCLHNDRNYTPLILGGALSIALVVLGAYLFFFDKTQKVLAEHQLKVSSALEEASKKDEFEAFLSGFTPDEQELLRAVRKQDGIQQSTLRFKTGMSKTSVSLLLSSLEERGVIARNPDGKTNKVFLKKRF